MSRSPPKILVAMKSKLLVNSNKKCNLSLLANKGVLLTDVIPQNFMYSLFFFRSILSASKSIGADFSFFLTPGIFEDAVSVLGLNSLGSSFFDSASVLSAYLRGKYAPHFGQS